jgi:hypothetical protein
MSEKLWRSERLPVRSVLVAGIRQHDLAQGTWEPPFQRNLRISLIHEVVPGVPRRMNHDFAGITLAQRPSLAVPKEVRQRSEVPRAGQAAAANPLIDTPAVQPQRARIEGPTVDR